MKTRVGQVHSEINKTTGEEYFYDNLGRETVYIYSSKTNNQYQFYCHGLSSIKRDTRKSFLQITHKLNDNAKHTIRLVADFKHPYKNQSGFHLNITKDSEKIMSDCKECQKYFSGFNHFQVFQEKSECTNITDADSIFKQIIDRLSQSILQEYQL